MHMCVLYAHCTRHAAKPHTPCRKAPEGLPRPNLPLLLTRGRRGWVGHPTGCFTGHLAQRHIIGVGRAAGSGVARLDREEGEGLGEDEENTEHIGTHRRRGEIPVAVRDEHDEERDELERKGDEDATVHHVGAPPSADDGVRDLTEVVRHQHNTRRLRRHRSARHPHRDAHVGRSQSWSVVDAVPDHPDHRGLANLNDLV
mmetsp:Transcript_56680/g.126612  ORF Transcript_56680/g.126612 Transcript_56680/m.126612 type:complete len:200 (+) Transcript_56680:383-982(+)